MRLLAQQVILARLANQVQKYRQADRRGDARGNALAYQQLAVVPEPGQEWRGIALVAHDAQPVAAQRVGHHDPDVFGRGRGKAHLVGLERALRQRLLLTASQVHCVEGKAVQAVVQRRAGRPRHEVGHVAVGCPVGFGCQHDQHQNPAHPARTRRDPWRQAHMQHKQRAVGQQHTGQHMPVIAELGDGGLLHIGELPEQPAQVGGQQRHAGVGHVTELNQLHARQQRQHQRSQPAVGRQPQTEAEQPQHQHVA